MPSFEVSPEMLVLLAGVVLSLVFSYVPGLNAKYAALLPEIKRVIMLALLALITAVVYAGTCAGWFTSGVICDQPGLMKLIWMFVLAMISNQSTYTISPQSMAVRNASDNAREKLYRRIGSYIGGE